MKNLSSKDIPGNECCVLIMKQDMYMESNPSGLLAGIALQRRSRN